LFIKIPKYLAEKVEKETPPGGLEPPTFRLTAERASQLRHGGPDEVKLKLFFDVRHLRIRDRGNKTRK
jgi:hypothetical protein